MESSTGGVLQIKTEARAGAQFQADKTEYEFQ